MEITLKKIRTQNEDTALGKLIERGMKTKSVTKESVIDALKGKQILKPGFKR